MSHELKIEKESHFGLKKKFYNLGYNHGFNGAEIQELESQYYLAGYQKGKKIAQKVFEKRKQASTLDDWL